MWSGSGIWERSENSRWIVVNNPIIPMIDRVANEYSLNPDLGITQYLHNFEKEPELRSETARIVSNGSTIVRVSEVIPELSDHAALNDEEPGSSSAQILASRLLILLYFVFIAWIYP